MFRFLFLKPRGLLSVFWAVALWILPFTPVGAKQDDVRIVIDTTTLTLKVMQGEMTRLTFSNIAIGRYGTSDRRRKGDNTTPLGRFTVAWITDDTPYHRFFGFRYPSMEYAERAFQSGQLDEDTWISIRQALLSGLLPPQDTILGGYLGIHGIGKGDMNTHKLYNWTNGCVALTNWQIDQLASWVRIGTEVVIH